MKHIIKRILLVIVFGTGAITLIKGGYEFIWPIIDTSGIIETGEYRGLEIGDTKGEIIIKTGTTIYHSKLKIVAYRGPEGNTIPVFSVDRPFQLRDSNTWHLIYPSIHQEIITLSFQDNRLHKIHYKRDMLSP